MGSESSKSVVSETTGNINNNLIIGEDTQKYYYYTETLLFILAIIKIMEFAHMIYVNHIRKIRRKYTGNNGSA